MDTPRDDALLRRFAAVYRGRHRPADALRWLEDPDADAEDGTPGPGRRLRALREAVFRQGAAPQAASDLRAAEAQAEADRADATAALAAARAAHVTPPDEGDSSIATDAAFGSLSAGAPRSPGSLLRWWPAVAIVVAAASGVAVGTTLGHGEPAPKATVVSVSPQQAVRAGVIASDGDLSAQDYYRLYPDDLPLDWGGASTGVSFTRLHGPVYRSVEPSSLSTEVLIVVTCAASDRRYSWRLFTADAVVGTGAGRCGDMQGRRVVLGSRHAAAYALRLQTDGSGGYAATVLQR